jgi:hypothetical protein
MQEEYRAILGFENYEISNFGNIRNIPTRKILKQSLDSNGYHIVSLYNNGKGNAKRVHRLIANAFIPNDDKKAYVDHIDGNKTNNALTNLRWATHSENEMNKALSVINTSGIKGVYWNKEKKKWRAQIKINGKTQHIGYFCNLEDAKMARYQRARELFGTFLHECEKL